jgi:hypothetical protein
MDEPSLICFGHECSVLPNHDEGLPGVEFLGHLLPGSIRVPLADIEGLTTHFAPEPFSLL